MQVSKGADPVKLPKYVFMTPEELTIEGSKRFAREMKGRLEWYRYAYIHVLVCVYTYACVSCVLYV